MSGTTATTSSVRASRSAKREAARGASAMPQQLEGLTTSACDVISGTNDASSASTRPFCAEDDPNLSAGQHMIAGAAAGMTEHMAMYPIDTVKTRMQSYVGVRDHARGTMFSSLRRIVSTEGPRALWRGVGAVALSAGPAHALSFATYEAARERIGRRIGKEDSVLASAAGGVTSTIVMDGIMTPLDVVKQRMQLSSNRSLYTSVYTCMRHVYFEHGGISAFFAGFRATLIMNVPFTAVYFSGYEAAKRFIMQYRSVKNEEFSVAAHCTAGAFAGGAAAAVTNPLDVVKTRLQTQGEIGARRYRGMLDALRSIRMEEGVTGLLRGVRPRVLFHVPAAAICWTTYEFCKHIMTPPQLQLQQQS